MHFSHPYQLDESISFFWIVLWYFKGNFGFAASYLVLHCWPMSHKKDTRLIWVNKNLKMKEKYLVN